jgi:hypothetical protein
MRAIRNLIAVISCLSALVTSAAIPELEPGVYVQTTNGPLTVNYYTAPSAIDWNNDGRKDLLVGQFTSGNIWLFLNQGTDARPIFGKGQQVKSGTLPITTTYG